MESSGKWAPDTQSSVARTVWRNRIVKLPSAGPKVARTVWRNRIVKLPSAGPKAARVTLRNRIARLTSAGPEAISPVFSVLSPISMVFPGCFHATQKSKQSQFLTDGNTRPRDPWCFHLFPWRMINEYRRELTLPFPHGNTQSSVSIMFRRCFHGPEKDQ